MQFHLDFPIDDVAEFAPQYFVLVNKLLNIAVLDFHIRDIAQHETSPVVGQSYEVRGLIPGCFVCKGLLYVFHLVDFL